MQKSDRIAFYLNNSFEFIIAYLANLKLGLGTVPISTQYRDMEITHVIGDATLRLILTDRTKWKILEPIRAQLTSVERVVFAEELAELPVAFVALHADKPAPAEGRIEYCTAHLALYKVPRSVTFVDSLPRNAMGKVEKKRLFAHFAHTDSPIQRAT